MAEKEAAAGDSLERSSQVMSSPEEFEVWVEQDFDHRTWPVLLFEPDPVRSQRFKNRVGGAFTIHETNRMERAEQWIDEREYAVVIAPLSAEQSLGGQLLSRLAKTKPHIMRIVLSEDSSKETLLRAMNQAQAYAFVTSPWRTGELTLTLRRAIERYVLDANNRRLVTKLREERSQLAQRVERQTRALRDANHELRRLATSDGLTGLYNHRYFQDRLRQEVKAAKRYGKPTSLLLIDVDHFKTYNDTLGHPQGDTLLREVSSLLLGMVREVDLVARYGGDEFAIAMPQAEKGSATILAERLRKHLASAPFVEAATLPEQTLTISIGVACFPEDGATASELISSADRALYRAKRGGRNQVSVADGYEEGAGTTDRDADLHLLVEEDGFTRDLTPRPMALSTIESLLAESDFLDEVLEDGDTMEHPASAPNLAPPTNLLRAEIIDEE